MGSWHTLLDLVRVAVEAVDGITEAPGIDPETISQHMRRAGTRLGYTIDVQSAPTDDRQRALVRTEHTITITLAATVKQGGQWATTYGALLDAEQAIIAAMLDVGALPGFQVLWTGTGRQTDPSAAYLRSDSSYSVSHTHSTGVA